MTKQEKIKLEWGELFDYYKSYMDEEGYVTKSGAVKNPHNVTEDLTEKGIEFDVLNMGFYWFKIRPKRLQNLYSWENNNGWIKIESEKDLPTTKYDFYNTYMLSDKFKGSPINYGANLSRVIQGFKEGTITHYKKVTPLKPPLW